MAGADTQLVFEVIGKDRNASRTLREVGREADNTKDRMDRLQESFLLSRTGLSGMATAALALGPALLPVLASSTVAVGGLAAAMASAGAVAGVFGAVAASSFGRMTEAVEEVTKAEEKLAKADTTAERVKATEELVAAQKKLKGPLGVAARGYMAMGEAWKTFVASFDARIFPKMAQGFDIVKRAIPALTPLVEGGIEVMQDLLDMADRAVSSGGFARFAEQLTAVGAPALRAFVLAGRDLIVTFVNLLSAFAPLSATMTGGLLKMTGAMATWSANLGKSAGFQRFLDSARQAGPLVISVVKSIAQAFFNLLRAVAPLGPPILVVVGALAKFVASVPPERLGAIVAGFVAIAVAIKGAAAAAAVFSAITAVVSGPVGAAILAVVALAAGMLYLWRNSEQVRAGFASLAGWVRGVLLPALQQMAANVLPGLRDAWAAISTVIAQNRPQLQALANVIGTVITWLVSKGLPAWGQWTAGVFRGIGAMVAFGVAIVSWVVRAVQAVISFVTTAVAWFRNFGTGAGNALASAFAFIRGVVAAGIGFVTGVIRAGLAVVAAVWRAVWGTFGPLVRAVWGLITAIVRLGMTVITGVVRAGLNIMRAVFSSVFAVIRSVVSSAMAAIRGVITAVIGFVRPYVTAAFNAIRAVITSALNTARSVVSAAFSSMRSAAASAIGAMISLVSGLRSRILGAVSGFGSMLFGAGRDLVQGLINGISSMIGAVTDKINQLTGLVGKFLPGSPVKEGPLTVLNRGYAGGQIATMLAEGIDSEAGAVSTAMRRITAWPATDMPAPAGPLAGPAAGAGGGAHLTIDSAGTRFDEVLLEVLRRAVRVRGGDVQVVLGAG